MELSPAETTRKARKGSEGPTRSVLVLGARRMQLAAVYLDRTRGCGEEDVRLCGWSQYDVGLTQMAMRQTYENGKERWE